MAEKRTFTEELLACCAKGPLDKVKSLLRAGAQPEALNPRGHNALQIALRHGHWDIARFLHRQHPELARQNQQQLPCLLAACQHKKDDPQGLELCVSQLHSPVNSQDSQGRTALLTASLLGHLKKTKWLLARGAAVNAGDKAGRSALMEATEANHVSLVRALLKAGADPDQADKEGNTALLCALQHKKPNLTVIRMLLSNGADPEHRNQRQISPWLLAQQKHPAACEVIEKHINSTRQIELPLFSETANKEDKDMAASHPSTRKPHPKVSTGTPRASDAASTHTARQTTGDDAPAQTALHNRMGTALSDWFAAARSGNLGKLQRLLLAGTPIDAVDSQGCSALIRAAGAGRRAVVAFLLERGADFSLRSTNGSTALSVAILAGQRHITRLLLKQGADANGVGPADIPLVLLAAAQWSEDQLLALHEYGASLTVRDNLGRNALHSAALACESQHNVPAGKTAFQFLLHHQVDLLAADSHGHTPLEILCGAHKADQYQARDTHVAALLHSILQLPAVPDAIRPVMPRLLDSCARHRLANARGVLLAGGA